RLRKDAVRDVALAGDNLLHTLVHGPRTDQPVGHDRAGLTDPPRTIARLVFDGRVPPAVVQDNVAGGREIEARAAGLERQHEGTRTTALLKCLDHSVPGTARQPAVIA